tara:strand:+ start:5438 stop:5998 length:561 start_codon:yes stop_codon:yes gene_type:complete
MTFLKDITRQVKNNPVLFLGLAVLVLAIVFYNTRLGALLSGMKNKNVEHEEHVNENTGSESDVEPAGPAGTNSGPSSASGLRTITSGVPSSCSNKLTTNPQDLLPKDNNNEFGSLNPNGSGELSSINLLKAGHHMGIDTVGSSLRNANLQVRSEPPNPQNKVSPWGNSTITPDLMRIPLELGSVSQ